MFKSEDVLRLSDRWLNSSNPDSYERQGQLSSCLVLVAIFHLVLSIYFYKMEEWESKHHPRRLPVEISFAAEMIAPPELRKVNKVESVPRAPVLIPFKNGNAGSESGAKRGVEHFGGSVLSKQNELDQAEKLELESKKEKILMALAQSRSPFRIEEQNSDRVQTALAGDKKLAESISPAGKAQGVSDEETSDEGASDGKGLDGRIDENTGFDDNPPSFEKQAPHREAQASASGNILPYKRRLLHLVKVQWEPLVKRSTAVMLVRITIAKDGSLIDCLVKESSGSRNLDRQTIEALQELEYERLPDWYQGGQLCFELSLSKEIR